MIELVGLEGKADRPIKGFSGGERQRLGIAQAEVNYPDLLILDEPAASLDPQGRRDVLDLFQFFIQEADRAAYLSKLAASLAPEGRALRLLLYELNDLPLERFEWLILCW